MSRMLITGGCIVTMDPHLRELPRGDLLIENGRIAAIAPKLDRPDGAETIDASGMIVMPGLINGHLHTWQSALRGIAGDWTVAHYMQAMHRGLATLYRPEDIYIANLTGALNQINNGATTLVDWCHNNPTPEHTDAAIEGLADAGIRAVFLHGSPKPNPKPGQKHFSEIPMPRSEVERLRKGRFASNDGLLTFGLAILGPYYSVWDVTRHDVALANELDLVCSMHVGGGTPITAGGFERLAGEKLIKDNFNVVHGNDIAPATIAQIVGHGGTFTTTAEVELQMGYGDPLTGTLRSFGAPMSIGTDVEAIARGDMFTAMRVTLQHERNRSMAETIAKSGKRPDDMPVTCRDALAWTTTQGAQIARLGDRTGSLAVGKAADVVLLAASDITMFPVRDPVSSIVMQGGLAGVDTVLIAGKVMKRHGKLLYPALTDKLAALRRSGDRILTDFGYLPRQAA
jgi:cytosine/adenosine deaminase-related metal-dependent hydrolase